MKAKFVLIFFLYLILQQGRAQNNWAPVPCYNGTAGINRGGLFVDSLHNELILNTISEYSICGVSFKAILAYNGNAFHDLDFGLDKHNPNKYTSGDRTFACIPFNGKTLFGGSFASVGSTPLFTQLMALWNGAVWDTFPKFILPYSPSGSGSRVVYGFLRDNGKLWIYGAFKNLGGVPGNNLYTFEGNNFTSVNIPVVNFDENSPVVKMIRYKNLIYALGGFTNPPSYSISRFAAFDGTSWSSVGNGIVGGIDNASELVIYQDTLYVAGGFSKASGNIGNYIMKWDGSQLHDAGFGGFYGWGRINQLLVYKNRLYAFGNFDHAADQKAFGVAYYENGQWIVPQDSIAGNINTAAIYNDAIYIGGSFLSINGDASMKYFAKLRCPDFDASGGCISGLKDRPGKLELKIFPNPAKNKLCIELEENISIYKISITNTLGQEIYKLLNPTAKQEIDITRFPSGIFYLRVYSENGKSGVAKILKE